MKMERERVEAFHNLVIGIASADAPHMDPEARMTRARLIAEEACEAVAALVGGVEASYIMDIMAHRQIDTGVSLAGYCDGAADLRVVLHGTDLVLGVHSVADEIYAEVCNSNMSKVGGVRDAHGKLQKPKGYFPPNISEILRARLGWVE